MPIQDDNQLKITDLMPSALAINLAKLDSIVQTGIDTLATTNLCVLASLSGGTQVYDQEDDVEGTSIILYSASFFRSGGGKTVSVNVNRSYFIDWMEAKLSESQDIMDKRRRQIEIELKSLGNSNSDRKTKADLEEELMGLIPQPDVYLEDATSEGFELSIESGSTPFLLIDNFGQYLTAANKNENKANMLRTMDNVFDSGRTTTRRLKGNNRRAKQLTIKGFGAHFASTLGDSNLKLKDLKGHIENGFLNKVLITFQERIDKPIPLKTSLSEDEKKEIEKFSRQYQLMASENNFYLSPEAYEVYKGFHKNISDEFVRRYNNNEDLAGMIIRLLKISKRIACIFEIASQCLSYGGRDVVADENRQRLPISADNMKHAIHLLEYLKVEHSEKIMIYAESGNGKPSSKDFVFKTIKRISEEGKVIDHRSILGRLGKKQRMDVKKLKEVLLQLIKELKIEQLTGTTYCLYRKNDQQPTNSP